MSEEGRDWERGRRGVGKGERERGGEAEWVKGREKERRTEMDASF